MALILLIGQSFFLGYAFALLYTVANSMFLVDYGSDYLPYAFIAIAIVVPLFSSVFSQLQKIWPLPRLALVTILFFTAMFFLAWAGLSLPRSKWLSFALLVGFTLGGLLCGIVRGAQAGYIFDARALKQMYPLIMGGEILGVIAGGISSMFLVGLIGSVENILVICGASMLLLLVLLSITIRNFRDALLLSKKKETAAVPRISLGRLLRKRYILLILLYQIFSAMGTRLVYYLFLNQAEAVFKTQERLTQFFGTAMAIATVLTLLFVVFLAGKLLTRFGMSLGLAGNPIGVGIAIAGAAIIGTLFGSGLSLFFWLILCAGFLDIILTSGLTDTTVQSSYQPLPPEERTAVRTLVEGVGIPIAFGLSGVCLLLFNWIKALTLIHVVYFTFFLVVLWTTASLFLNRNYGDRLKQSVRRRWLDHTGFSLKDRSSLEVIEKLLQSTVAKEVILALELVEKAEHPSLYGHLSMGLRHQSPDVRQAALAAVERGRFKRILPALNELLKIETQMAVRAQAVRSLCALRGDVIEETMPYLEDKDQAIRMAALVGLFRYGGVGGVVAAVNRFNEMASSADVAQKRLLARVLGEIGIQSFYQPLIPLLADESPEVRQQALLSAGKIGHPKLWPLVIENLKTTQTRSAAMSALLAAGNDILPILEASFAGKGEHDKDTVIRLIRLGAQSHSEESIRFFKGLIEHCDGEIQFEIFKSLNLCGYRAEAEDRKVVVKVLYDHSRHALRTVLAKMDFGPDNSFDLLKSSLDDEFNMQRTRIFLLLSFLYDPQAIMGAERKLVSGIKTQVGLALELLDVLLAKELKRYILPLIDENTPLPKRVFDLMQFFDLERFDPNHRLQEIITDTEIWPSSWTRACAIYAAALSGSKDQAAAIETVLAIGDHPVRETAAWALSKLDSAMFSKHVEALRQDPNPVVSRLAHQGS